MTKIFKEYKLFLATCIICLFISSCQQSDYKKITINRFDTDITNFCELDRAGKDNFEQKYHDVISLYINKIYPDTFISINTKLENFVNSNATKYFTNDIKTTFHDITSIQTTLSLEAEKFKDIANINYPKVFTAIIPYNQSILINDSTAIIGLNHYLGADHPAYEGFPSFRRNFKIPEKIHYDMTEAIIKTRFQYQPKDNTLLEKMIYEGMVALLAKDIITDFDESMYFCISKDKIDWCKNNEVKLWNQLLIDESLYITSETDKSPYLNPAPFTPAFTQDSPGMACRWLGMKIVAAYINKCNISPIEIMQNKIYQYSQTTLINSQYNGK